MDPSTLEGALVRLREATEQDLPTLVAIRSTPEVYARWGESDDDLTDEDLHLLVIEYDDRIAHTGPLTVGEACLARASPGRCETH